MVCPVANPSRYLPPAPKSKLLIAVRHLFFSAIISIFVLRVVNNV